jgi:hypothetical protein
VDEARVGFEVKYKSALIDEIAAASGPMLLAGLPPKVSWEAVVPLAQPISPRDTSNVPSDRSGINDSDETSDVGAVVFIA